MNNENSDKKKVLIADDEPALLRVTADAFREAGFEVFEADDGQKALNLALTEHPDCVLLDIQMPKIDGLTVLQQIRQDEWGKSVYVVILTNFSDAEKVAKATENYVFDYLTKQDWSTEEIVSKVKEKLQLK